MDDDKYRFYRTELRVLRAQLNNDELFLNAVANQIGKLTYDLESAQRHVGILEDAIRHTENS